MNTPTRRSIFRAAAVLAPVFFLLAGRLGAAPPLPVFRDDWTPDPYRGLAVVRGDLIDEQEVYIWLLLKGGDPLTVRDRENPDDGANTASQVERAIYDLLETRVIAEMPEADEYQPGIDAEKARRIVSAPAAFHAFAERTVRTRVQVTPIDIARFYREHPERYGEPETVVLRMLRVPYANPSLEARDAALEEAARVRREAVLRGGLQSLLRDNEQYRTDSPGETTVVRRGRGDVTETLEDQAFRLEVTQIGTPLAETTGVYLMEVLERRPSTEIPVHTVAREIREILFPSHYAEQFDVIVRERLREKFARDRTDYYHLLSDDMEYLGVGDFELTKGEFLALYPEYRSVSTRKVPRAMQRTAREILRGQLVIQYGAGARNDFYLDALDLSEALIRAEFAQRHVRASIEPGEADVRTWLENNREEIAPSYDRTVWRLSTSPRNPASMTADELLDAARGDVVVHRTIAREGAGELAERAELTGENAYAFPEQIVRRLIRDTAPELNFLFQVEGVYSASEARESLGLDFTRMTPGSFSDPRSIGNGTVVTYYVGEQLPREQLPEEILLELAAQSYVDNLLRTRARQRIHDMESDGRLRWKF